MEFGAIRLTELLVSLDKSKPTVVVVVAGQMDHRTGHMDKLDFLVVQVEVATAITEHQTGPVAAYKVFPVAALIKVLVKTIGITAGLPVRPLDNLIVVGVEVAQAAQAMAVQAQV
jgi:hypothetical protein